MSRTRLALTILLYVIGVAFIFDWRPYEPLLVFFPRPQLLALLFVLILVLTYDPLSDFYNKIISLPAKYWLGFCGLTTLSITTYIAFIPLEGIPHSPDDICYLWQARTFTTGHLFTQSHDLKEFFHTIFFVNDGRWYSLFQPGWPLFLTLGVWIGLPNLINPILTAVATILLYPIGRRVFSDQTAKLAMLMFAVAPMHVGIGSTLLSHSFSLVLTEIIALMILILWDGGKLYHSLILGLALGWLFATRGMNGFVTVILVGIVLSIFLYQKRIPWTYVLWVMIISAGCFFAQMAYNHALTGNALYWPQDRYFDQIEPKKDCHKPGFGKQVGCPITHPGEDFPQGFTPIDALHVTHTRLGTFLLTLLGWNAIFLFIGFPFFSSRGGWKKTFLLSIFLSLLIGYFCFYFHGLWGRYYYESSFALFLLIAAGIERSHEFMVARTRFRSHYCHRFARAAIPAMGLSYFALIVIFFMPLMFGVLGKSFMGVDNRLERMRDQIPPKSIVIMQDSYPLGFLLLDPMLTTDRIFVKDLLRQNRQLMQYYPDYHFFRYSIADGTIHELPVNSNPSPVYLEGEYKFPIASSSGEHAYVDFFTGDNGETPSGKMVLTFPAKGPGSYYEFQQYIFKSGHYKVQATLSVGPNHGIISILHDNQILLKDRDCYSPKRSLKLMMQKTESQIYLEKGLHTFRVKVTGKAKGSTGYNSGLDRMLLLLQKEKGK